MGWGSAWYSPRHWIPTRHPHVGLMTVGGTRGIESGRSGVAPSFLWYLRKGGVRRGSNGGCLELQPL